MLITFDTQLKTAQRRYDDDVDDFDDEDACYFSKNETAMDGKTTGNLQFVARVDKRVKEDTRVRKDLRIGSLSTSVFETRTPTGSELFSLLTCLHTTTFALLSIFSPLEIISIKIRETSLPWLANCSLPVAVRV